MTTDELNIKITADTGNAAQTIGQTANELERLDDTAQNTSEGMSELVSAISTIAGAATQVSAAISATVSGFAVFNSDIGNASGEINKLGAASATSAEALTGMNVAAADFSGSMQSLSGTTAATADNMEALQSQLTAALTSISSFSQSMSSAGADAEEAAKKIKDLSDKVNQIPAGGNVVSLAAGFKNLKGIIATLGIGAFIKQSNDAYVVQMQNELKLAAHMKQRMNATDDEIKSIKALASEQQKLGVIGDEIQLAGTQQLTTYAKQTSTLNTLIPAMNNLIAQNAGYEASVGDATSAADMLGRALNGQYTSLRRYGIVFTEAQKKVMEYGTEAQKAELLADAINAKVGNMNYLLMQTPTGQLKQLQMELGDFQEELAALWQPLIASYVPVLRGLLETVKEPIKNVVTGLTLIGQALSSIDSPATRAIALTAAGIAVLSKLQLLIGGTSAGLLLLGAIVAGVIGSMQETQTSVSDVVNEAMSGAEVATDNASEAAADYADELGNVSKAAAKLAGFDTLTKLSGSTQGSLASQLFTESDADMINDINAAIAEATENTNALQGALNGLDFSKFNFSDIIQGGLDLSKDFWSLIFGDDEKKYEILKKWTGGIEQLFGSEFTAYWENVGASIYDIFSGDESKAYEGWKELNSNIKDLFGEDFTNYWNTIGGHIYNIINGNESQIRKGWEGLCADIVENIFGPDFANYFKQLGAQIYKDLTPENMASTIIETLGGVQVGGAAEVAEALKNTLHQNDFDKMYPVTESATAWQNRIHAAAEETMTAGAVEASQNNGYSINGNMLGMPSYLREQSAPVVHIYIDGEEVTAEKTIVTNGL